ncbi:MAG: hypothetical protein R2714_03230 [Microthrixaceae bacterium]
MESVVDASGVTAAATEAIESAGLQRCTDLATLNGIDGWGRITPTGTT